MKGRGGSTTALLAALTAGAMYQRYKRKNNVTRATRVRPALKNLKRRPRKLRGRIGRPGKVVPAQIKSASGSISKSLHSLVSKPNRQVSSMKRIGAPNVYVYQYPQQLRCAFGFQNAQSAIWNRRNDLTYMLNTFNVARGPRRFVLESLQADMTFTNQTNASVEVDIYDIICKRDLPNNNSISVTTTAGSFLYNCTTDPVSYWYQGANAAANTPGTVTPFNGQYIGSSPFDSQFFKDYFRVVKRTSVHMSQGAAHRHVVLLKPNRLIDEDVVSQGSFEAIRGLTSFTMINVKGLPCSDLSVGSVATTTGALLDVISQYRYKFTQCQDATASGYFFDNLTTPAAASASILNIGDGAVSQVNFAG